MVFIRCSAHLLTIFVMELEESRIKRRSTLSTIYAEDVTLVTKGADSGRFTLVGEFFHLDLY